MEILEGEEVTNGQWEREEVIGGEEE